MPGYHHKKRPQNNYVNELFWLEMLFDLITWPLRYLNRKINKFLFRSLMPSLGQKSVTSFGLKVKSRAELRIAEFLHQKGIRFEYEKPVRVWLGKKVYPDFYLPDFNVYLEYEGLLNHRTRGHIYRRGVAYKKQRFKALGLKCYHLNHYHKPNLEFHLTLLLRELRQKKGHKC